MADALPIDICQADNRDVLASLADCSVDAIVTDPPYALVSIQKRFGGAGAAAPSSDGASGVYNRAAAGFMGRGWDTGEVAFATEFWAECWRVLKPGGHVVAFSGTRTYHRLACAIEDAGFECRDMVADLMASDAYVAAFLDSLNATQRGLFARAVDESAFGGMLAWVYGTGFPKSHDVAKGIDAKLGFERAKVRVPVPKVGSMGVALGGDKVGNSRPWIDKAREAGFHEAASPEAASPEAASPEAAAWQGYGTALKPALEPIALMRKPLDGTVAENVLRWGVGALNIDGARIAGGSRPAREVTGDVSGGVTWRAEGGGGSRGVGSTDLGRWPANVVHDGSAEVLAAFPDEAGAFAPVRGTEPSDAISNVLGARERVAAAHHGDRGSAARFFYSAKASAWDRMGTDHPTVKRVDLMDWLVRLVCPPGGLVLDPFAGSGTTGLACLAAGRRAILVEREADHVADIRRKIAWARGEGRTTRQEMLAKKLAKDPAKASGADAPLFAGLSGGVSGGLFGDGGGDE